MYVFIIYYLQFFSLVISFDLLKVHTYCRDRDRLINTEKLDEYLLVDVEPNTILQLECHFCNELVDNQPKLWYYQDRYQQYMEQELEIGMNNNKSTNKIYLNSIFDLIIKDFQPSKAGIYKCYGVNGQDKEKKFNYRLEPVFQQDEFSNVQKGNLSDWKQYRDNNLIPVTNRFAVSKMTDLSHIRNEGITLEIISEWSKWSPCQSCVDKSGIKSSKSQCRLKSTIDNRVTKIFLNGARSNTLNFFASSPILPCRSQLLNETFPIISKAIINLPEFILEEPCDDCNSIKKKKNNKFKYKVRHTLTVGSHLTITCPESNKESHIVWKKERHVLARGYGQSFRKHDVENHILIDIYSTLYLIDVSDEESGNYTCYVDEIKMMQATVVIVSSSGLITRALLRHMGYLGLIFLITSFCYCAGVVYSCKNPPKHTQKDYKMVLEELKEKKNKIQF